MILTALISIAGGAVGGFLMWKWLRGRAIDNEVRVAYVLSMSEEELGGFDIAERSKVASGSVYSVLAKFESLGMVTSRWEEKDSIAAPGEKRQYPHRRRLYTWHGGLVAVR